MSLRENAIEATEMSFGKYGDALASRRLREVKITADEINLSLMKHHYFKRARREVRDKISEVILLELLNFHLSRKPEREETVFRLFFRKENPLKQKEIAILMGVTSPRISTVIIKFKRIWQYTRHDWVKQVLFGEKKLEDVIKEYETERSRYGVFMLNQNGWCEDLIEA
jgi:hypothetical protein